MTCKMFCKHEENVRTKLSWMTAKFVAFRWWSPCGPLLFSCVLVYLEVQTLSCSDQAQAQPPSALPCPAGKFHSSPPPAWGRVPGIQGGSMAVKKRTAAPSWPVLSIPLLAEEQWNHEVGRGIPATIVEQMEVQPGLQAPECPCSSLLKTHGNTQNKSVYACHFI